MSQVLHYTRWFRTLRWLETSLVIENEHRVLSLSPTQGSTPNWCHGYWLLLELADAAWPYTSTKSQDYTQNNVYISETLSRPQYCYWKLLHYKQEARWSCGICYYYDCNWTKGIFTMSSPRVLPRIVEREIACKENRVTRLCHFKMDVCKNTRCSVTGARGGLSATDSII